jgi:hypothetical protein
MTYEEIEVTEGSLQGDTKQIIDLLSNMAHRLTELERRAEGRRDSCSRGFEVLDERIDRLSGVCEREINGVARNVEMVAQEVEAMKYGEIPAESILDADLIDTNKTSATDTSDRGQGDAVEHPSHYNTGRFETIEIIEEITQGYDDGYVSYCVGNAVKYLSRAPFKHESPHEDIHKASKYLEFALGALK